MTLDITKPTDLDILSIFASYLRETRVRIEALNLSLTPGISDEAASKILYLTAANLFGFGESTPGAFLHFRNADSNTDAIVEENQSTADGINFNFRRSRGTNLNKTILNNGDEISRLSFSGYDGDTWENNAYLRVVVDGAPSDGVIPLAIELYTSADGTPVKRVTIASNGTITFASALVLSSTLALVGNLNINTNKFTVDAATGNTAVAGNHAVAGNSTVVGTHLVSGESRVKIGVYSDNLATAITAIGATPTSLVIDKAITLADGETLTIPATLTLEFTKGGTIDGLSGGGVETLNVLGQVIGNGTLFGSNLTVVGTASPRTGNVGGNFDRDHFAVSCIPRCTAGTFALLDDSGHHPLNVSSISQVGAYTIKIDYSRTAGKINSFMIQQDDALAPYGIDIGGDVGVAFTNVIGYTNLVGLLTKTTWTPPVLLTADAAVTFADDILTLTHPAVVANDVPVVSVVSNVGEVPKIGVGYAADTITIQAIADLNGYVSYNGATWSMALNDISAFETGITQTWATNVLRITHPSTANYNIQVTGHGGIYIPQVLNVTATYFDIGFFDYAGAQVTVENTNMKVWIKRDVNLRAVMPTNASFLVRRGNVPIESDKFSNVAGNNFWVNGMMEV